MNNTNQTQILSLEDAFNSTFHNKYLFEDFLEFEINQAFNRGQYNHKTIIKPGKKLNQYLRFLNNFIFNHIDINTQVVHSYVKGKNTYTAVKKHCHSKYFFQTDIRNFFGSISKQDIKKLLSNRLNNTPINDIEKYKTRLLELVAIGDTLPVGLATSPNISNTFLYEFDNNLASYCSEQNIIYTRYCDDIILSSSDNNLQDIENIVQQKLENNFQTKLTLNPSKTKHLAKGKKIKLLGLVILPTGKVSVDIKLKKQLEVLFYFYSNDRDKFDDYLDNTCVKSLPSISGKLHYINMIDRDYLDKLRKKYGSFLVDSFLNKTIK